MVLASPGSLGRFSNRTLQNTPNMPTGKHSTYQHKQVSSHNKPVWTELYETSIRK